MSDSANSLQEGEALSGSALVDMAKASGLVPKDWTVNDPSSPSPSEIHEALNAVRFSMRIKGETILSALVQLPENYRGHVILALYPEVTIGPPVVKVVRDPWNHKFNSADGPNWRQLYDYYTHTLGWDYSRLSQLDQLSDVVLFELQDPDLAVNPKNSVKGLVVGYVQSGKTANYTAVTAKAFDAGYRLVIVLTGIHNSLRRQTQLRMEDELGLVPSSSERPTASPTGQTGKPDPIYPLSNSAFYGGDSIPATVSNAVVSNQRSIFVIKKNVSVLNKLIDWLPGDFDKPVLIIDDEADQASINTNLGEEVVIDEDGNEQTVKERRTATNEAIIRLLNKFPRVSYVGYTATPYANVFIDAEDSEDLYPRDFIIPLPKPDGYFGPTEFFGDSIAGEGEGLKPNSSSIVELVDSSETVAFKEAEQKVRHWKANGSQPGELDLNLELPDGLRSAVERYLLTASAYHAIFGAQLPSAMLVQATPIQEIQLALKDSLSNLTSKMRAEWRYDADASRVRWREAWEKLRERFFQDASRACDWNDIEPFLASLLGQYVGLEVLCLNHKSPDELDYELRPNFTGIVVGGNKLSRGLTIEGLLTSYFVREAKAPNADTLSQMGRFFGYRKKYADLVSVFTTDSLLQDFRDVSFVEEELREELLLYSRTPGMTPSDFGPRVALRGRLMPTARTGKAQAETTFSGAVLQTSLLVAKDTHKNGQHGALTAHKNNFERTASLVESLDELSRDGTIQAIDRPGSLVYSGVRYDLIANYLKTYEAEQTSSRFQPSMILKYVNDSIKAESGATTTGSDHSLWNLALIGTKLGSNGQAALGSRKVNRVRRSLRKSSTYGDIGSLINPLQVDRRSLVISGDEAIDLELSSEDVSELLLDLQNGMKLSTSLRLKHRANPLLCIYSIDPSSAGDGNDKRSEAPLAGSLIGADESTWPEAIIGLTVFFPRDAEQKTIYLQGNAGGNKL